jgi:hypothetical protein
MVVLVSSSRTVLSGCISGDNERDASWSGEGIGV